MQHAPPGAAVVPLTRGHVAIVDEADHAELARHRWHATVRANNVYAVRFERRSETGRRRRRMVYMHRQILGLADGGPQVDHRNLNGLDNRRSNLRVCTRSQNMGNVPARGGSSRFKGVQYRPDRGKWQARIGAGATCDYLGMFDEEDDAARAYDHAALDRWGEFALLNFPTNSKEAVA